MQQDSSRLLLVSIGNTRMRLALARPWEGERGAIDPSRVVEAADADQVRAAVNELAQGLGGDAGAAVVATVHEARGAEVIEALESAGLTVTRLTNDGRGQRGMRVPIQHELPAPVTVGVDRLLGALGAFARSGEACVVIDAGTAVTVDFVDGFGVFKGGVIAPGLAMQLRALHTGTSALPEVDPPRKGGSGEQGALPAGPWGTTTREAMLLGCARSVQGLVRTMVDRYAEANGGYPRVIATGGDAPLLFENDELVEHIVPDLTLMGMMASWQIAHGAERADQAGQET